MDLKTKIESLISERTAVQTRMNEITTTLGSIADLKNEFEVKLKRLGEINKLFEDIGDTDEVKAIQK